MVSSLHKLPEYAPLLLAFHEAFSEELRAILRSVPIPAGGRILDVACGDGFYSLWLAERAGTRGQVTAVDLAPAWLELARQRLRKCHDPRIRLVQGDARHLPFASGTFDFVWCAHSLCTLSHPRSCLAEMARVLRPGGTLALMENDSFHHVLLPLPALLELQLRAAELAAFRRRSSRPSRFYIGRWLPRVLRQLGLQDIEARTYATTRIAPYSPPERTYFQTYLQALRQRVAPFLAAGPLSHLDTYLNPDSRHYLLAQPDLPIVCIDRVAWGQIEEAALSVHESDASFRRVGNERPWRRKAHP